jgi:hypothetical protein
MLKGKIFRVTKGVLFDKAGRQMESNTGQNVEEKIVKLTTTDLVNVLMKKLV